MPLTVRHQSVKDRRRQDNVGAGADGRPGEQERFDHWRHVQHGMVARRYHHAERASHCPEDKGDVCNHEGEVAVIDLDGALCEVGLYGDDGKHVEERVPSEI